MTDFIKELEIILETDPLGLLLIKPKASLVISKDERLVASFEEINSFMREHNREPAKSRNISERKLYSRLKGFRENPEMAAQLTEIDSYKLLANIKIPMPKEINTIDDVLEDDTLGLLESKVSNEADPNDIFTFKNIPKSIDMPEHVAKRKPCKDFASFEQLFKQCYANLDSGINELRDFTGEQQIAVGHFFVLHGIMVYVAEVGSKEKKRGKINARLRCIFENGTESNMLLRSLATELYKDEAGRRILDHSYRLSDEQKLVTKDDEPTGYIYVLKSLSEDPQIKEIENLYKIGFSSHPIKQRMQNAEQDPTFLMAAVIPVTEFKTYNLNPQKLELLLHTFFSKSCLNLDIFDSTGKRHTPREWFVVPLHVIKTAVQLLINGEIINYRYDNQRQEIAEK
jgi:hypothetical protein